jgi:hypothetical protein
VLKMLGPKILVRKMLALKTLETLVRKMLAP